MRTAILTVAALCAGAPALIAQPAPNPQEPVVQLGIIGSRPDGRRAGGAFDTEPSLESTVYTSRCVMGVRNSDPPADAEYAWRFAASVVDKTAEQATIQVRWRRVVDAGQAVSGAEQSVQVTVRVGESVDLDAIGPASCDVMSFALAVRYEPHPVNVRIRGGGRGAAAEDVIKYMPGSGGAARAGSGSGGGVGSGSGSGSGGGVAVGRTGKSVVRSPGSGTASKPAGGAVPGRMVNVDLWLVHQAPGREERVLYQVLRGPQAGADFTFAPVAVELGRGSAMVQIGGTLSVSADNRLVFSTYRRVTYPQQPPRDAATQGRGQFTNTMPAPGEVVAIKLPPIRAESGDGVLPDRFELRVRFNQ